MGAGRGEEEEELEPEEKEDLFVFNDTMEGPRAPAVKFYFVIYIAGERIYFLFMKCLRSKKKKTR